ncbi:glutamyl-tRNA reductase [Cerasicoccus fimbriatus]|uniref:glutamyl-tRNA reductase n=1 Tax=Cerasicoccus fimbriatus TaxID=3014554 RepID=UPI0022B2C5F6|nr:glutamyl-tRNA reductase [Cerasicoccus sp. TK19100]
MPENNGKALFVLGSSHRTASIEVRERLALDVARAEQLAEDLRSGCVEECLILNTCNRVEIYGVTDEADLRPTLLNQLAAMHGMPLNELENHSFWLTGEEAVRHAFEVASGLDSQMVGENEILGQLKDAYAKASDQQLTGRVLNRVFQKSFQTAKWIRTNTGVSKGQVSIGNIATELAIRVCGDLADVNVVLLGSGEVGEKTTQALVSRGAQRIVVAARNLERARLLAEQFTGAVAPLEKLPQLLERADIIIGATSAPQPLITRDMLKPIMKKRPAQPLIAIDTALPRDIEQAAEDVTNVYLYNLDHLAQIANENLRAREAEVATAKQSILERAKRLWESMR